MTSSQPPSLDALSASFSSLESALEPLLSQGNSLPETLLGLSTIQQAKLQTVLPYLVYDLIFIYLKTKGVDPRTHPVVPELDRVKEYFQKISTAENPIVKRTAVDKGAASRFIKHAITQSKNGKNLKPNAEDAAGPSTITNERVAPRTTSKMIARQEYERELRELDALGSENEEDGLLIIDDGEPPEDVMMSVDEGIDLIARAQADEEIGPDGKTRTQRKKDKQERKRARKEAKGKGRASASTSASVSSASTPVPESAPEPSTGTTSTKKRRMVDPFAGGDDSSKKRKES